MPPKTEPEPEPEPEIEIEPEIEYNQEENMELLKLRIKILESQITELNIRNQRGSKYYKLLFKESESFKKKVLEFLDLYNKT